MHDTPLRARRPLAPPSRRREFALAASVVLILAATVGIALAGTVTDVGGGLADDSFVSAAPGTPAMAGVAMPDGALTAADAAAVGVTEECTIESSELRIGASGDDVICAQQALAAAGLYDGPPSGTYDDSTYASVRRLQEERDLFVDGNLGRETARSLDIWPDEASFVVRTPPPAAGAEDELGFPLSSVASTGADAPPLPPGSGSGRRVVYERAGQRVWAVDEDEHVIRSWLVSGSQYGNEVPGTHKVYSRSEMSTAWNGKAYLPLMIRWDQTDIGAIGFHALPVRKSDGSVYQTEAELGTRLSGGCQRQADRDAAFLWAFAPVGTTVVVL